MKIALPSLVLALMIAPCLHAQSRDAAELTALLNGFLAGASRNDAVVHEEIGRASCRERVSIDV